MYVILCQSVPLKSGNLTIHFHQRSIGTHIRRVGQYLSTTAPPRQASTYLILLEIYSGVTMPKIIEID